MSVGTRGGKIHRFASVHRHKSSRCVCPDWKCVPWTRCFRDFLTVRAQMKTTRERAKEEILKYKERDSLGLSGDVLQWWKKTSGSESWKLSALAKSFLSIPATSCWHSYSTDHADKLIFLKKNKIWWFSVWLVLTLRVAFTAPCDCQ